MKICNLSISNMIWRFYLMMLIVIVSGFTGLWFMAVLALPVFMSAMLGIPVKWRPSIKKPDMVKTFHPVIKHHHPAH